MDVKARPWLLALATATASLAIGAVCGDAQQREDDAPAVVPKVTATPTRHPGAIDFNNVTTIPFPGYPSVEPPRDFSTPTCLAPEGVRPDPDLPPLSCRRSNTEPPPGSIATPSPSELPDPAEVASEAPAGWTVIDNGLFRYTMAIPPGWFSNMQPEGGSFNVFNAVTTRRVVTGNHDVRGGVSGHFDARLLVDDYMPGFIPLVEEHLQNPNALFGNVPGAIWENDGEGAEEMHAAFAVDGVVFEIWFGVADIDRSDAEVAEDVAIAKQILGTIHPY